jgi:excinuclease ABC subunit A
MQTLAEDDTHVCEACHGHRLRPESRSIRLGGRDFTQVVSLPIHETLDYLKSLVTDTQPLIIKAIDRAVSRLNFLEQIGLGYLSLARPARTLSAGESRRVSLTSALGSGLVNTLYVLDEPSIGLHPRDIARLVKVIEAIRDAGNTVVVVEHDEDVMLAADHLVDIGPGAGEGGGRVIYRGPPRALLNVPESLTAQFLNGGRRVAVPDQRRTSTGRITIQGAAGHNLKGIDVTFPLGVFCVVTGVSGAGKSTLIDETLVPAVLNQIKQQNLPCLPYKSLKIEGQVNELILVDQSPIGRSARSNPVTYLKAFDEIRKTFAATHEAKTRNYAASKFSFNVDGGRCSTCEGNGQLLIDMQFLADVTMCCPDCKGTRYRAEVLEVTYRGKSIAEVLDLTAREAFGFFRSRPKIQARLRPLLDVGLEYLRLGQPGSTLSGGEAQRLKLASYLASSPGAMARASVGPKTLFVFDEPTTGLHPADTLKLIEALRSLLVIGHSLLIVEHNPDIMMSADWLIDLGPEAGADGGRVVGQGTPEDLAKLDTATGRVLAQYLNRSS